MTTLNVSMPLISPHSSRRWARARRHAMPSSYQQREGEIGECYARPAPGLFEKRAPLPGILDSRCAPSYQQLARLRQAGILPRD